MRIVMRLFKWIAIALVTLVALVILVLAAAYVVIGRDLRREYTVPLRGIEIPGDAAAVAEGRRLAMTRGCYNGCHGTTVEGRILWEGPDGSRLTAPNLTRALRDYSTPELERVIRHGIKRDGTSVVIMPSRMFAELTDADLGAIIAYLKTVPDLPGEPPATRFGPLARLMGVAAKMRGTMMFEAEAIDHSGPRVRAATSSPREGARGGGGGTVEASRPTADGGGMAAPGGAGDAGGAELHGRYLAYTSCIECHGDHLRGAIDGSAPGLSVVKGYSLPDFTRLMRTGVALGNRELPFMGQMSLKRFTNFTDAEIAAVHRYLQTLP